MTPQKIQALSPFDQHRFNDLLLKQCGLQFSNSRIAELEHAVRHAFAASTCSTLDEYYALLSDVQAGTVEMDRLINAVTINETHFFRDRAQFNALYHHILPQIIERKRPMRTMRIWSAGCSSGEEPYSLAMLLRELLPDIDQWSITLLGTDINTASLERANRALYSNWAFREDRAQKMRSKYFQSDGGKYALIPEVRHMAVFKRLNLVEPSYPSYETNTMLMDLILCRNVTIYFSEDITRWIVDRFYDAIIDGGWLVVGHAEPSLDIYRRFHVRNFKNTLAYQKSPQTSGLKWPTERPVAPDPVLAPPPPRLDMEKAIATTPPAPPQTAPFIPASESNSNGVDPMRLAVELIAYGRSDDARDMLLKLVRAQPRNAEVYALLGKSLANLTQWDEAEKCCVKAISLNRLILDAYYTLALVLQHKGNLAYAIEAMKKVVYIDHTHILGHYGLANLYYESNLLPQAQKSLDNALRLLNHIPEEAMIPGSDEIAAGRLRQAIVRQQQAWSAV